MWFFIFVVFFVISSSPADAAVYEFDELLDEQIREYGVFNGSEGLLYASLESFGGSMSLFTAYFKGGELGFAVFDNRDGPETTDRLSFPVGGRNTYTLSLGSVGADTAVILTTNGIDEPFVIRNDRFERSYRTQEKKTEIASYKNGRLNVKAEESVFSLLKSLKNRRIRESAHYNAVNDIDEETKSKIVTLLASCADIMSFDVNDPDHDRLMRYIMCTHKNFTALIDIKPQSGGGGGINYVSAEFIDYIIGNVFRIEPVKPGVDELVTRGYCLNGTLYYYSDMFNVDFSTEILDIIAVYELGGRVYYVIFSDVYHRGKTEIEEYSFAVVRPSENGVGSILRLGMGEPLLTDAEIAPYAPLSMRNNYFYTDVPHGEYSSVDIPARILLAVTATSAIVFAISTAVILRRKK